MSTVPTYSELKFSLSVSSVPRRILIVDDEPAILFAYQKLLQRQKFIVDTCGDLTTAQNLIDANSYYALIADLRLTGSESYEGVEVLRYIRRRQPETKTIVISGFGNEDIKKHLHELGTSYYFDKPVRPAQIMEILMSAQLLHDTESDDYDFSMFFSELSEAECL